MKDEIRSLVKSVVDRFENGSSENESIDIAPMGIIIDIIEELGWEKFSDLDSNGWDCDYSVTYYQPNKERFVHITASGYYGHARIYVISNEEAIDSLSYDEATEIESEHILNMNEFQNKMKELREQEEALDARFYESLNRTSELLKKASKLVD